MTFPSKGKWPAVQYSFHHPSCLHIPNLIIRVAIGIKVTTKVFFCSHVVVHVGVFERLKQNIVRLCCTLVCDTLHNLVTYVVGEGRAMAST